MPKLVIWEANEYSESLVESMKALGVTVHEAESEMDAYQAIEEAEGFYGRITRQLLGNAGKLQWIQATSAGLDGYFFPELRESGVTITNQRGIYSDVIADHVFGYVLCFARGLHVYRDRQREGVWRQEGVDVIFLPGKSRECSIGLAGSERKRSTYSRISFAVRERPSVSGCVSGGNSLSGISATSPVTAATRTVNSASSSPLRTVRTKGISVTRTPRVRSSSCGSST